MRAKAGRCAEKNARGEPCGMPPVGGSAHCFAHDPKQGAQRARARKSGGRNRRTGLAIDPPTEPAQLRHVAAIQQQIEAALFNTLQLENSNGRSRTVGYLLGFALKALETGELEARVAALEAQAITGPRRVA